MDISHLEANLDTLVLWGIMVCYKVRARIVSLCKVGERAYSMRFSIAANLRKGKFKMRARMSWFQCMRKTSDGKARAHATPTPTSFPSRHLLCLWRMDDLAPRPRSSRSPLNPVSHEVLMPAVQKFAIFNLAPVAFGNNSLRTFNQSIQK